MVFQDYNPRILVGWWEAVKSEIQGHPQLCSSRSNWNYMIAGLKERGKRVSRGGGEEGENVEKQHERQT